MDQLILSSDECYFLSQFRQLATVGKLSEKLGVDAAHTSRKLAQIARRANVLERVNGRWSLTPLGEQFASWYDESVRAQRSLSGQQNHFRVYTTQTLSERWLTKRILKLQNLLSVSQTSVVTHLESLESALLSKQIDLAITCHVPHHPEIRFKRLFKSDFVAVATNKRRNLQTCSIEELMQIPYIAHSGLNPRSFLDESFQDLKVTLQFDHLSGVRQSLLENTGWSILPHYAIESELKNKELIRLAQIKVNATEDFQMCWRSKRFTPQQIATLLALFKQEL